ncbi:MAG: L-seryl-tRNA(Sec) selenium transferase [Steroidobacteraceae bacterium]|nr:L-seryl-tRNA(Sec) selenium transferase [Deltaproteobacteria bacterium]
MTLTKQNILTQIPKVDRVLEWPDVLQLLERHPRPEVLVAVRLILERLRESVRRGTQTVLPDNGDIIAMIASELSRRSAPSLRRVINGSGVVVHTNLGRSPLADAAEQAIHTVSAGYSNLEFDLECGERGSRYSHVEGLLCELTGSEAALVVNNNAAAVILALSSLAQGRDVIVSRGELVEIGGSFRIPDVMCQSGARLVEVGCTNRTHIRDYLEAISDTTALLLKVHTSNFAIVGFTAEVTLAEMSTMGRKAGIPVMLDAGSGCLIDLSPYGIKGEPTIRQYLESGVDVVTFSGDKLLGGPQAGIIAGSRAVIEPMKRHPLLRALRMDKLNLASLEATLRLYRDERQALTEIPTLRMLTMTPKEISLRAERIIRYLRRHLPDSVSLIRHPGESSAGGGSFPLLQLPTTLIEIRIKGASPSGTESTLRQTSTPIVGRIHRERFLIDARTILDNDFLPLLASLQEAVIMLAEK